MPRSRSRSLESMTRSTVSWFSRYTPPCLSIWSTRVVLPWSTWAIMATFLSFSFCKGKNPFLLGINLNLYIISLFFPIARRNLQIRGEFLMKYAERYGVSADSLLEG